MANTKQDYVGVYIRLRKDQAKLLQAACKILHLTAPGWVAGLVDANLPDLAKQADSKKEQLCRMRAQQK